MVFRIAVVAVVLILAAGPSAALLCTASCDPDVVVATGACHADTSARLTGNHACDEEIPSGGAFVREDTRRGLSSVSEEHAFAVPRYQLARMPITQHLGHEPGSDRSLERRTIETTLRI
jgi:hypothetical protein